MNIKLGAKYKQMLIIAELKCVDLLIFVCLKVVVKHCIVLF